MTQAQVTVAKTAAKTANKGKTATKTESKPKAAPKQAAAKTAKAAPKFTIRQSFRPSRGAALFAYSVAWLQATGLIEGKSIPRALAVAFAGQTAIGYHVNTTARMVEDKAGMVSLSAGAAEFFKTRGHQAADVEAFAAMFQTGEPDGRLVKNKAGFVPLEAGK